MPFASALDVSYTGQHSYDTQNTLNLNSIDLGTAYLAQYQDPTLTPNGVATSLVNTNVEPGSLLHRLRQHHAEPAERLPDLPLDPGVVESPDEERHLASASTTRSASPTGSRPRPVSSTTRTARSRVRDRIRRSPTICSATTTRRRTSCARTSSGSCRAITSSRPALKALGLIANDWNLAGIWSGATGAPYSVALNYVSGGGNAANVALTGSPDFAAARSSSAIPAAGAAPTPTSNSTRRRSRGPSPGASGWIRGAAI